MENTEENKSVEIAKNQECQELKNIKYKTMLLNGQPLQETKLANDLSNLDFFLEHEKKQELVPYNGSIAKDYVQFNLLQFPNKLKQLIYKFLLKINEKQQQDREMEDVKEAILEGTSCE